MTDNFDLTRRKFLLSSAAAAAAMAAAGANVSYAAEPTKRDDAKPATTRTTGPSTRKRERKKLAGPTTRTKYYQLKLGVIGIDGRGRSNLEAFVNAGANIVAICDTDTQRLDKCGEELDDAKKYADFREMLSKEKLDGVVISTPDHTHAPAAMMAMRMGKHVYCEKPLTYDIYEARMLTEAARKYKVKTQMGNQGTASDSIRRQVDYAKSDIVGPIREVHVYTNRPIWPQGNITPTDKPPIPEHIKWDLWLGPAPDRAYHPEYLPFKWRGWWDFGTGALGDMACHLTNSAYWALNLRNPGVTTSFQNGMTKDSPPKWSIMKWEFPELDGRPATKMFWYDGGALPPHTQMAGKKFPGDGFNGVVFVGDKGNIAAGYMEMPFLVDDKMQKEIKAPEQTIPRLKKLEGQSEHHVQWLDAILDGSDASSNFDYAGPLTEMVLVGNLSVRTGRRVEWDQKNMRVTNDREAQKYVKREYRGGWTL